MGVKSIIAKIWAKNHIRKASYWKKNAVASQERILLELVAKAEKTLFGIAHDFKNIRNLSDFQERVPIQDYESLRPFIDKIKHGDRDILWPDTPLYLAKTSGTTSGSKYIPISKEGMPYQISAAQSAILHYIHNSGNASFTEGKMIFLQGNPTLDNVGGIPTGRLSGIVAHHIPSYLQKNRLPSWKTNCIDDWEAKLDAIIQETAGEDMRLISGIPPWMIMYFERLEAKTGKTIRQLFPKLQLIITGGVNYQPYEEKMKSYIGNDVDVIQTFPASEGFFAFQDQKDSEELLLLTHHGIFYEFIPLKKPGTKDEVRLALSEVEIGEDYALLLTTNSGLWAYSIGDVIRFTSLSPYRIQVSGRTKHFTSAFGEHVIAYEVEEAMRATLILHPETQVNEFHLCPQVNPEIGLPYHEWFIEFGQKPRNMDQFSADLDAEMCKRNVYYEDLIKGNIIRSLLIYPLEVGSFNTAAAASGKLGGQNKLPRLANNREFADLLIKNPFI